MVLYIRTYRFYTKASQELKVKIYSLLKYKYYSKTVKIDFYITYVDKQIILFKDDANAKKEAWDI